MSTSFRTYVEEVERNATPDERRVLEESRRRFAIGARLLDRRLAAGMSQRQLAAVSGIDRDHLPHADRALSVARHLAEAAVATLPRDEASAFRL